MVVVERSYQQERYENLVERVKGYQNGTREFRVIMSILQKSDALCQLLFRQLSGVKENIESWIKGEVQPDKMTRHAVIYHLAKLLAI